MLKKIPICLIILLLMSGCKSFITTENRNISETRELIHSITTSDGKSKVELCYDRNILLKIDNQETVVSEIIKNNEDIDELKKRYSLFEAGNRIISVVYKDLTAARAYIILELFKYKENQIDRIFSSRDILAKIRSFDEAEAEIEFSLPKYNAICSVKLTDDEQERWKEKKSELDNGSIKIDSDYFRDIQDNLVLNPIDYYIEDVEQSNDKKLYILLDVYTVGAITPSVRDRAITVFDLSKEYISFENIIFARDSTSDDTPFAYFNRNN